jgi:hypothetical protein
MAGAWYIWIIGAFFVGCGGVLALLVGLLFIGHWFERKQTGATHGFLEVPEALRTPRPATPPPEESPTDEPQPPQPNSPDGGAPA